MTHTSGDMFGIRTPTSKASTTFTKSPEGNKNPPTIERVTDDRDPKPNTGVRRSIGEIEAKLKSPRAKKAGPAPQHEERTRAKPTAGVQRTTFQPSQTSPGQPEKESPMKATYKSRTSEAKACLLKAKLQMDKSRNLKADIKADVIAAVERLYVLVKEAEQAKPIQEPQPQQTTPQVDNSILADKIEQHKRLLQENNQKMEELREELIKQRDLVENTTYANVVQAKSPLTKRATLHSIIVTSTDDTETGDEVLDRVRKAVDAKEGWVTVEKVRKAKDRKIIMGLKSKSEQNKVRERLEKSGHLLVEEVQNKDPLLILRDVLLVNTDDDVLRALRNQNRSIFAGLDKEEDRVSIKYRRRARNPHTGHIVISVSPKIWRSATEAGVVHIDLQCVRVADQSPLVQCSRCLAFGHGRRFCKESVDLCSHCGGPHLRAQCTEWLANGTPNCRNCSKARMENAGHNAFSGDCPTRQRWDALARTAVAYC